MFPPEAVSALAALFIVGMVWLRTRMHYRGAAGRKSLTRAGLYYFVALALVLIAGYFAAPALVPHLVPGVPVAPSLARVVFFLLIYYLFIPVHRALRARGVELFKATVV